jgi:hypothetical protein
MSALPATTDRMLRVASSTPVDRAENAGSITINSDDDAAPLGQLDLTSAITEALERAHISHKEAALMMGIDPAQWSRQLHGDGHISLQRLQKLPRQFWLELLAIFSVPLDVVIGHPDLADRVANALLLSVQHAVAYAQQDRALRAVRRTV